MLKSQKIPAKLLALVVCLCLYIQNENMPVSHKTAPASDGYILLSHSLILSNK